MFHGFLLERLQHSPFRVFFNAVNLEKGRHAVIGPLLESGLRHPDLSRQWKERPEEHEWRIVDGTPLASAVAASTAFPPWFAPVPISMKRGDHDAAMLHFVDGGVTDNAGFKLARGLSLYSKPPGGFKDRVGLILTIDASRPPQEQTKVMSRARATSRLAQVAQNAQFDDQVAATIQLRDLGHAAYSVGLQVGFHDETLARLDDGLRRVRTHLDGFTSAEIGALGYCGYARIDYMASNGYLDILSIAPASPADDLKHYLKALGLPPLSIEDIAVGLRRSSSRSSLRRFLQQLRDRLRRDD